MGNDWTKDFGFAREEIFRSEETLRTIRHIRASWGGEPEFLWEKFPDYAVFRRQDNAKWYAVILTVQAGKLGLADEGGQRFSTSGPMRRPWRGRWTSNIISPGTI